MKSAGLNQILALNNQFTRKGQDQYFSKGCITCNCTSDDLSWDEEKGLMGNHTSLNL